MNNQKWAIEYGTTKEIFLENYLRDPEKPKKFFDGKSLDELF